MRKRRRLLFVIASALVLLLLLGAALFWPSEPYRFLEGARVDEVRVSTVFTGSMSMGLMVAQEMCVRRYFVADVGKSMDEELEADGWEPALNYEDPRRTTWWFRSGRAETVELVPLDNAAGFVTITTHPAPADRFQAWLWSLTHR